GLALFISLASLHFPSQSSCQHHALHSFPTRRSSDLHPGRLRAPARGTAALRTAPSLHSRQGTGSPRPECSSGHGSCALGSSPRRSEEHTSELQSRENLVCRLLLEKKKK